MEQTPLTLAEALTANFYAWERRGRGWRVWDEPVVLEPPFQPFFHSAAIAARAVDDGRRPGVFERIGGLLRNTVRRDRALPEDSVPAELVEAVEPARDEPADDLVEFQVRLPADIEVTRELAEQILLALGSLGNPVSFEVLGTAKRGALHFVAREDDAPAVRQAIEAYLPDAALSEERGAIEGWWGQHTSSSFAVADFGLAKEFMLPLRTPRTFAVDPLTGFLGTLESLGEHEVGVLQVLFQRTAYPWAESVNRAVSDGEGGSFFMDAPEMLGLARGKISRPLFACVVRAGAFAPTFDRARRIVRSLGSALDQFSDPSSNELVALSNDDYDDGHHLGDLIDRQSHRSGMLLSVEELASLVHPPSASVRSVGLRTPPRTTKAAPDAASSGDVTLGENIHRSETVTVKLRRDVRLRHTYAIGATGTGKSTLLLSMIRQDIEAGRGVGVIDPHGDLVEDILGWIPESRARDVVLFDPSDEERPVGFNVLHAHSSREKDLLASDLVAIFRRFSTSWGDQMTAVLGNAVLAFLESEQGGTLVDLRRFLVEKTFRDRYLESVRDPMVVSFWKREFPLLKGVPQAPLLTRLDALLRPRSIRMVVAQRESRLDLGAFMDRGGICLAKLSQGAIGEENAYLLGSLLVAKFHQMALSRERSPEADRRDFFLYLDEFHNFTSPSLAALLAGARKYHVGLVLAHQELRQLRDRELESAVLTNAATRVCFRLGDEDARKLADGFAAFDAEDLQSLGVGEAICRVERADWDFNVRVVRPSAVDEALAPRRREALRLASRARYGIAHEEVEAAIADSIRDCVREVPEPRPRERASQMATEKVSIDLPQRLLADTPGSPERPEQAVRPSTGERVRAGSPAPRIERAPGRGGPQHKYLQSLIKHFGEEKGFRATLEAPVSNGGRIDVLLERGSQSLACEISIGSSAIHEVGNIQKCLSGGHARVAIVSPERRTLKRIEAAAERLSEVEQSRISFVTPDELLSLLDEIRGLAEEREDTVLGYRVKTRAATLSPEEQETRKRSVVRTIVRSLKRLKEPG